MRKSAIPVYVEKEKEKNGLQTIFRVEIVGEVLFGIARVPEMAKDEVVIIETFFGGERHVPCRDISIIRTVTVSELLTIANGAVYYLRRYRAEGNQSALFFDRQRL
ncbi:MAG: hypothetical protein WC238_01760 [Parcubacteria group bacterium]|jgi:hypothetical protein